MKYEFHVGDYVSYSDKYETYKGYVREYMKPTFSKQHCFVFQWDDGHQSGWSGHIEDFPHNFIRIGQYDFTKKDKNKIEPLDYTERFICESTVGSTLISYMKKINELVDAVNELRKTNFNAE